MKGSIRLFTIAGIPLKVHWTFSLLILWVVFNAHNEGLSTEGILFSLLIVLGIFICVILHEFGHAIAGRRYSIPTFDITVTPIGGIARLERMPDKPKQEIIVALAGPFVNVLIALFLGVYLFFWGDYGMGFSSNIESDIYSNFKNLIPYYLIANVFLVGFNLIPAFPMDGGRVLRALLSLKWSRVLATKFAMYVGWAFAALFLVVGVYLEGQYTLPLISFFIFYMARTEYRSVLLEKSFEGFRVKDMMQNQFTILNENESMERASNILKTGKETNFLVMGSEYNIRGVLTEATILKCIRSKQENESILSFVKAPIEMAMDNESIKSAYFKLQFNKQGILPISNGEQLVGVVDERIVEQFLTIRGKMLES